MVKLADRADQPGGTVIQQDKKRGRYRVGRWIVCCVGGGSTLKTLPETLASPLLRTDFSDDVAWKAICNEISKPGLEGFRAEVEVIDDGAFEGFGVKQIVEAVPEGYPHSFIIVADQAAMAPRDRTLLVVNLDPEDAGQHFRAVMAEMWAIENNLSIANMDFADFANAVDDKGVFRGF